MYTTPFGRQQYVDIDNPVFGRLAMDATAEVISIGDELTSGQRLDTNSQWLSERLGELGIRVVYHTTVADDLAANVGVFRAAAERVDVVIATGGLGPTADDLTREALAAVLGVDLVLHEEVVEHIRGLFARFGRHMPERNRVQAMFPAGTTVIDNPAGTAPGIQAEVARPGKPPCQVFALPGVPAEMQQMWQATVAAELARLFGTARVIRHRRIKCFGISESEVEERLPGLIERGRTPTVGITVSAATITLRITAAGATAEECQALAAPTEREIRAALGHVVFGEEEDELENAVARLLVDQRKTLATVEWGTGGLVADRLHEVLHAREEYLGGLIVPSARALSKLLGVPPVLISEHGPVSAEVADAMVRGCRDRTDADLALAVSQFPDLESTDKEARRLFVAVASADGVTVRSAPHFGHPSILKTRAAKQALNMVRLALLGALPAGDAR